MPEKTKIKLLLLIIFIIAIFLGFLDYPSLWNRSVNWLNNKVNWLNLPYFFNLPYRLGLDLQGGTSLLYEADLSNVKDYKESLSGLRDVIERRVNLFGVAEPVVQTARSGNSYRLIVELAGIKNINEAIQMIGETPYLEFKEERTKEETDEILKAQKDGKRQFEDPYFKSTRLTGKYLKRSVLGFDQTTYQSVVNLELDSEGAKIFEELTRNNLGKRLAIYLDGAPISAPVVRDVISGGKAVISGNFTLQEAKKLVERLNAGALPVPIKLISQESIGASLGERALRQALTAGLLAFLAVALFMILWYRLPGFLAVIALIIYTIVALAIFKIIPVTLTLAGIAGFILSVGMAVDANILIFARMREEFRSGRNFPDSINEGFRRAWPSIRDSNITTILSCIVLYVFSTSMVKGFALTLGIGVIVSMFSAIIISRLLLKLFIGTKVEKFNWLWYK